jgi:hypothetical protein
MAAGQGSGVLHKEGVGPPEQGTVVKIDKRAGAMALVGFDFYLREGRDGALKKVRVDRMNQDGQIYQVIDLRAKAEIERDVRPSEMFVVKASRSEDDPVIKLLRQIGIDKRSFLDPRLARHEATAEEYRRPVSRVEAYEPLRRSAPPILPNETRGPVRPFNLNAAGIFRARTSGIRGEMGNSGGAPPFPVGGGGFGPFQPNMHARRPTLVNLARPGR